MSRIGKEPVKIPSGVEVKLNGEQITVKGPMGELTQSLHHAMNVTVTDEEVVVERPDDEKPNRSLHGLTRSLVANMVHGVTEGYTRNLEIVGVGYRAQAKGSTGVTIQVGYSHPVDVSAPEGITFEVPSATQISVKGIDKQAVGQVAADIRKIRSPEPYKGKGIRYADEVVRRKSGKAAGA